jgi:hypothetical protein
MTRSAGGEGSFSESAADYSFGTALSAESESERSEGEGERRQGRNWKDDLSEDKGKKNDLLPFYQSVNHGIQYTLSKDEPSRHGS